MTSQPKTKTGCLKSFTHYRKKRSKVIHGRGKISSYEKSRILNLLNNEIQALDEYRNIVKTLCCQEHRAKKIENEHMSFDELKRKNKYEPKEEINSDLDIDEDENSDKFQ